MIEIQNSKFSSFFKISFNSTNTSQNCQDSKFEQIFAELSRFKKSSSHFFDQIFTKSNYQNSKSFSLFRSLLRFSQNCQNSRSFFLFDPKISTKFSPLPLSLFLRSKFPQDRGKIHQFTKKKRMGRKWRKNKITRCRPSLTGPPADSLASKIPFFLSRNPSFPDLPARREGKFGLSTPLERSGGLEERGSQLGETWPKKKTGTIFRKTKARSKSRKTEKEPARPAGLHTLTSDWSS